MNEYDKIIGNVIVSMIDLKNYVVKHEESKTHEIETILELIRKLDEYMAYGE